MWLDRRDGTYRSRGRGTADRPRLRPHSRRAVRRLTHAVSQPAGGDLLAGAWIGEHVTTHVGQGYRVIQLAVGQQPGVGGDRGAEDSSPETSRVGSKYGLLPYREL